VNPDSHSDPALRQVLQAWQPDLVVSPRFKTEVWQRIGRAGRADRPDRESARWQGLWQALTGLLIQPRTAAGFAAALLLVGASAGLWHGRAEARLLGQQLERQYVVSVSPIP
jgi:hypothetical protein